MADPAPQSAPPDPLAATLADLQAKHPDADVEAVDTVGGRMIIRTPDEAAYAKYITDSSDVTKRAAAMGALCRRCILWPDLATVDAVFRRKPGLPAALAGALMTKAGAVDEIKLGN